MIKEKTFIEVEYTGRLKETNQVFDTTNEELAKKEKVHNPNAKYGAVIICVGQGQLLKGIENGILGKEPGKYSFDLKPEDAFGKKRTDLIRLIPTTKLLKEKIQPMVGLQLDIDGSVGLVKSVSGGRTIIDFNHPLSGKEVHYDLEIKRIVTDAKEQIKGMLDRLGMENEVELKEQKASIKLKAKLPKEAQEELKNYLKHAVDIKEVDFVTSEHKSLNSSEEQK
ncbi:FKBP-type peptidyl-prolyl cis-trans isomerase [Candidatus Woesearchaeota archaeon]|nr:FKBP-type peptidyl-prolyl cis-trans isomerase [Candidatus Woesearchaeota archaeon]